MVALSSVLYFSFDTPVDYTPTLTVSQLDSNHPNTYRFAVSGLPTLTAQGASFRIFLSHGDGTYFIGTPAEIAAHTYTYNASGTTSKTAYAEAIPQYDDTVDPKRAGPKSVALIAQNPVTPPSIQLPANTKVHLDRICDAVAGDNITYIVTYEYDPGCVDGGNATNPISGKLVFDFDKTVFSYAESKVYFNEDTLHTNFMSGTATAGQLTYNFSQLKPGEQRNLFIVLHTLNSATDTSYALSPKPKVELSFNTNCPTGRPYTDEITSQKIRFSHDPNYKTVMQNGLCGGDEYVTWRIDFQNEGNKIENDVTVVDWIDPLLDYSTVVPVASSKPYHIFFHYPQKGQVRFIFDNIGLRGLGERGIDEESTKGYVVLKAKKNLSPACNAVVNRARIHFGCKAPIITKDVFAYFACNDTCTNQCITVLDTTLPVQVMPNAVDSFPLLDAFMGGGNPSSPLNMLKDANVVKWYPAEGLSSPFELSPKLGQNVKRTYVLVASLDSCRRMIVRVPVVPEQKLQMNVQMNNVAGCPGLNPVWNVTATATGAPAGQLVWQDCKKGVDTYSYQNLSFPNVPYFSVWDTVSECSVEQWIPLPASCNSTTGGGGCRTSTGVIAVLVLVLLVFLLFRMLRKK